LLTEDHSDLYIIL